MASGPCCEDVVLRECWFPGASQKMKGMNIAVICSDLPFISEALGHVCWISNALVSSEGCDDAAASRHHLQTPQQSEVRHPTITSLQLSCTTFWEGVSSICGWYRNHMLWSKGYQGSVPAKAELWNSCSAQSENVSKPRKNAQWHQFSPCGSVHPRQTTLAPFGSLFQGLSMK